MRLATVERVTATDPADHPAAPKVRVGLGLGARTALNGREFGAVVDEMEAVGLDSLWLSERISGPAPDPIVAMSYAAGRTARLKVGTSVLVLPGRNPVVLAKELATLAVMSGGRLLPAFGLGVADGREHQAFGVQRTERAAWFDEALAVMRACWTGAPVDHHGARFHYEGLVVQPVPLRLDVWLGGIAPSELRRVGRLADGWLPSFVTPADAAGGRRVIEAVADEHGRAIDGDHFGALIPFLRDAAATIPDRLAADLRRRRPDVDDSRRLVPVGWAAVQATIRAFVDVGTTKFVLVALDEPTTSDDWLAHVREASEVASEHEDA